MADSLVFWLLQFFHSFSLVFPQMNHGVDVYISLALCFPQTADLHSV